jgi:hypothetical protein
LLIIANKLLFQNKEKKKDRANELIISIKRTLIQNEQKEKRAAELVIANKELLFQNEERKSVQSIIVCDALKMKLSLIKSNRSFLNYSIKIRPPWLSGGSVIT